MTKCMSAQSELHSLSRLMALAREDSICTAPFENVAINRTKRLRAPTKV